MCARLFWSTSCWNDERLEWGSLPIKGTHIKAPHSHLIGRQREERNAWFLSCSQIDILSGSSAACAPPITWGSVLSVGHPVMKHVGWPLLVMLLSCHNWSPWVYEWRLTNTFNETGGDEFDSYLQNSCFDPITPPFTTVPFYLWCRMVRNSFSKHLIWQVEATVAALVCACVLRLSLHWCIRALCFGWRAEASHYEQIKEVSASPLSPTELSEQMDGHSTSSWTEKSCFCLDVEENFDLILSLFWPPWWDWDHWMSQNVFTLICSSLLKDWCNGLTF